MPDPRTFCGARARASAAGVTLGWLRNVSGNESYTYDEVDVMGVLEVAEYVLVGYRASFQAELMRIIGRTLKSMGLFPTLTAALTSGDLSIGIEDTLTGEVPYQFIGARCADKRFTGAARTVFAEDTSWVAIRVLDETERPAAG